MIFTLLTNQIHKWAHMSSPPKLVCWLQRSGLILSTQKHEVHHTWPFVQSYSITSGLLNPVLNGIGFYRKLEKLIHHFTGMVPRADDLGQKQASKLFSDLG